EDNGLIRSDDKPAFTTKKLLLKTGLLYLIGTTKSVPLLALHPPYYFLEFDAKGILVLPVGPARPCNAQIRTALQHPLAKYLEANTCPDERT
ncbi:MAG TPA: hypothetical protein VN328_11170, partial [Thermodesulfovibrionales bacterium]|nr:hypothetical protein [Thermodesulfovibrionales bacterium]